MEENKVGKTIAMLRKQNGLTQVQLAEKLYVSDKAISRWESGTGLPEIANLIELAKVFQVTVDYIVNGEGVNQIVEQPKLTNTMSDERLNELLNLNTGNATTATTKPLTATNSTSNNHNTSKTKDSLNVSAIISLVLAGLSIVLSFTVNGLIGLVLAIVALIVANNQLKHANLSSNNASMLKIAKTISIISIVLSLVMTVISFIILLLFGTIYGSIISNFWMIAL